MAQTITRAAIQAALDTNETVTLVEALPASYYDEAHLPGALQINHDEVDAKASILLPDKSAKIIVYCSNAACTNSGIAAHRLNQLGYSNVFKYVEGKQDWIGEGLPVEKTPKE